VVTSSTLFTRRTHQLATLASRHALPAIFPVREAGGLMSFAYPVFTHTPKM